MSKPTQSSAQPAFNTQRQWLIQHRLELGAVAALLLVFFLISYFSIVDKTVCADEPGHLQYGIKTLVETPARPRDSVMPVTAFNAIPLVLSGLSFQDKQIAIGSGDLLVARTVTILFGMLLGLLCYGWARQLYGKAAALLTLTCFAFAPNLIAHSRLVTTDLYATLMIFASIYALWWATCGQSWRRWALAALVFGLAQCAKFNCTLLLPITILILTARYAPAAVALLKAKDWPALRKAGKQATLYAAFYVVIGTLAINVCFQFHQPYLPLRDYPLQSDFFKNIRDKHPTLASIPIPLPFAYVEGLDWVKHYDARYMGTGHNYLWGEIRPKENFKTYYLWTYLYKVPLATQVLTVFAMFLCFRGSLAQFRAHECFLIAPVVFWMFHLNVLFNSQTGIRYMMIILPFLLVLCGRVWRDFSREQRRFNTAVGLLLAWQIVSVLSYFPHYIPYFNELVLDKRFAHRVVADTNLDYSQNQHHLRAYLEANPDVIFEPEEPIAGHIVVNVNKLVGIVDFGRPRFRWLREHFEPVDHIAHSYLVYRLTEADITREFPP